MDFTFSKCLGSIIFPVVGLYVASTQYLAPVHEIIHETTIKTTITIVKIKMAEGILNDFFALAFAFLFLVDFVFISAMFFSRLFIKIMEQLSIFSFI